MGGRESKIACISYEDAVKRVSESELQQIRDAAKRLGSSSGSISRLSFHRDVLGDGVPMHQAELIYTACGGAAKSIGFKELLCGLVIITKGTEEERIKFLFNVYAGDNTQYITRSSMLRVVHKCEGRTNVDGFQKLFRQEERVGFPEYRHWVRSHRLSTELSTWLLARRTNLLLSDDLETPTFYQSLAGVTHLEEGEILELEQRYWSLKNQSASGQFDRCLLAPLVAPPLPVSLVDGFFQAFDDNRDGHIDFKEMACGVSAACRGPLLERHKFCFKVFDGDRDGRLSVAELRRMVDVLGTISAEALVLDRESLVESILSGSECGEYISQEEYLMWTLDNSLPEYFVSLVFQMCHVVLGLRPRNRREEGDVVLGWLCRQEALGYQVGAFWYLVNMSWWRVWSDYVGYQLSSYNSRRVPLQEGSALSSSWGSSVNVVSSGTSSLSRSFSRDRRPKADSIVARDNGPVVVTSVKTLSENPSVDCLRPSALRQQRSTTSLSGGSTSVLNSSPGDSPVPLPSCAVVGDGEYSNGPITVPTRPSAIDNTPLVQPAAYKVSNLTGEGGRLRSDYTLMRGRDFELVPECLWKAVHQWYGGSPALPRQVINSSLNGPVELELHPITLRLLRHQTPASARPNQTNWTGSVVELPSYSSLLGGGGSAPKRYMAYTAAFSRLATVRQLYDFIGSRLRLRPEDTRLWHVKDDSNMSLWEEESASLEQLCVSDNDQLLIEVRNKDQTWPEEMSSIANLNRSASQHTAKNKLAPIEKGVTGLNNLGNTCFMNTALQCCSNTAILTRYFTDNMHLYELNRRNPLGMKGHIALCYAELIQDIWRGSTRAIAPLKLRFTIGKYAPRFCGVQQHDAQELLAFLLDGLHEDLNRVHDKPYVELRDSEGRPDVIVAQEAWENHILRNKSIIVDLFHGQLKSKVTCRQCGHESVRFDPFNVLSLPLPMENFTYLEVILVRMDGSVPVRYGMRLNMDARYSSVKQQLQSMAGLSHDNLLICELVDGLIKFVMPDGQRVSRSIFGLYAFEIPGRSEPAVSSGRGIDGAGVSDSAIYSCSSVVSNNGDASSQPASLQSSELTPPSLPNGDAPQEDDYTVSLALSSPLLATAPVVLPCSSSPLLATASVVLPVLPCSSSPCPVLMDAVDTGSTASGSTSDSWPVAVPTALLDDAPIGLTYLVAYHRKMERQESYLLSTQKLHPLLFGLPVIVPASGGGTLPLTGAELYDSVWTQVTRLVSPPPPAAEAGLANHAQDCDDSLGYRYPFVLKCVGKSGLSCSQCPWYMFCRGCPVACSEADIRLPSEGLTHLAIDWDPTALHLRYLGGQEKVCLEDESVALNRQRQTDPIDLSHCLQAFTREETLGEQEKYYCSKCKLHRPALKKLQIWRLPPLLIVHLKRFQFMGGRWIKSQKVVDFPFRDFDPTDFLASVPRQTVLHHRADVGDLPADSPELDWNVLVAAGVPSPTSPRLQSDCRDPAVSDGTAPGPAVSDGTAPDPAASDGTAPGRTRNGSVVCGDQLQDFHQHRLHDGVDPLRPLYRLYALSCHTGILGGGHYVCYAQHRHQHGWYFYNDSSCKEVPESVIDTSSAYLLFYEREGLDCERYMPKVSGRPMDVDAVQQEYESEFRKVCSVM